LAARILGQRLASSAAISTFNAGGPTGEGLRAVGTSTRPVNSDYRSATAQGHRSKNVDLRIKMRRSNTIAKRFSTLPASGAVRYRTDFRHSSPLPAQRTPRFGKRQHEPQRIIVRDLLSAEMSEKQARSIKYCSHRQAATRQGPR
jgi:hypothetical protein